MEEIPSVGSTGFYVDSEIPHITATQVDSKKLIMAVFN
jgi:hypothetical protein